MKKYSLYYIKEYGLFKEWIPSKSYCDIKLFKNDSHLILRNKAATSTLLKCLFS